MENKKEGYYYGIKFNKNWLLRGIKELIDYIKIRTNLNIIIYYPSDGKYFYLIYDQNLLKDNGNLSNFQKSNHWLFIREKLDLIFDDILNKFMEEMIDQPRKIFVFLINN